jgi:hypothetical protein
MNNSQISCFFASNNRVTPGLHQRLAPRSAPSPLPRDLQKRQKKAEEEFKGMIKDLDQFTNLVLAKPCLLEKPKCANLKHFLHIIYHDKPLKYPMLSFTEAAKVTEMNKTKAITLTPGVSKALYERTTVPFNPVVQVTCKDRTVKEVHDPEPSNISQTLKMPSYTLSASDGDKKVFTIKLATQLGISAALIDSCSVICLTKFLPLYYNYEDKDDARVLLFWFHVHRF